MTEAMEEPEKLVSFADIEVLKYGIAPPPRTYPHRALQFVVYGGANDQEQWV